MNRSIAVEYPPVDVRVVSSKGRRNDAPRLTRRPGAADPPRGYCRAFVQFQNVQAAVAFVKAHFPSISMVLPVSTDEAPDGRVEVYIHFGVL